MQIAISMPGGKKGKTLELQESVFNADYNESLVHQLCVSYLAGQRTGTRQQKNRSAVRGGGSKPWRQKGTGRARAGTIRSPLWRGGGVTFPSTNQSFEKKVNKNSYRAGMRTILSELNRQERLVVVENLELAEPKTKLLVSLLGEYDITAKKILIITDEVSRELTLACRNLGNVQIKTVKQVNPVSLVESEKLVITESAIVALQEWLES